MSNTKSLGALLFLCLQFCWLLTALGDDTSPRKEAYATLLYGDKFLLGVRVLGESLRRTQTTRDLVAIVTGDISQYAEATLLKDGWIVKHVDTVHNPGKWTQAPSRRFPSNFWAVYTKLLIFNLTEYDKVVYLDADIMVTKSCDGLFKCPGFCAVMRHSERFNSGVMVVTPSASTMQDMMSKVHMLPSYTGGDQGFLNAYFEGFVNGFLFDDNEDYTNRTDQYMRLPTKYNADVGLYVANSNRWMLPRSEIHVIHFTLGPFKPWVWWTSWLVKESAAWQRLRYMLPPDAAGRRHGQTWHQVLVQQWWWMVPPLVLLWFVWQHFKDLGVWFGRDSLLMWWRSSAQTYAPSRVGLPPFFALRSIVIGYGSILAALLATLTVVPPETFPLSGWVVTYEWAFMVMALLFGKYLQWCYHTGEWAAVRSVSPSSKVQHAGPWFDTLLAFMTAMVVLLLTPWMGAVLGVSSFVGNIMSTIMAGLFAVVYMTWVFVTLPQQWFMYGRAEGLAK